MIKLLVFSQSHFWSIISAFMLIVQIDHIRDINVVPSLIFAALGTYAYLQRRKPISQWRFNVAVSAIAGFFLFGISLPDFVPELGRKPYPYCSIPFDIFKLAVSPGLTMFFCFAVGNMFNSFRNHGLISDKAGAERIGISWLRLVRVLLWGGLFSLSVLVCYNTSPRIIFPFLAIAVGAIALRSNPVWFKRYSVVSSAIWFFYYFQFGFRLIAPLNSWRCVDIISIFFLSVISAFPLFYFLYSRLALGSFFTSKTVDT